jgi:hypothetical protein
MFFQRAREDHARRHNPDYDLPGALIGIGACVILRVIRNETE